MGNYQELIFYQKARQVVKAVDALVKSWPSTIRAKQGTKSIREENADYLKDSNQPNND